MLDELYLPSGKSLHTLISGQSGSGKSHFMEVTASEFLKKNRDPNIRLIYYSPKQDGFTDLLTKKQKTVSNVAGMLKSMETNYLTVFFPDSDVLEELLDEAINTIFELKVDNPDLKVTIIIDDAQVFLTSRKEASKAHRRLGLLGRSREINAIYVSHQPIFNKALEAQISTLIFFNLPNPIHYKDTIIRYGFDPEPYVDALQSKPYSFVYVDVTKGKSTLMAPIGE